MSYGLKYTLTFREEIGTATTGAMYKINIYKLSYGGSSSTVTGSDNPITLSYKKQDLINPIVGSELTIGLMSTTNGQFIEFATAAPLQYYVDVLKSTDNGSTWTTYWSGVNTTDCYSEPYQNPPYAINLKFNCGLGELQFHRYENAGSLVGGLESLILTVSNCLSFLPYVKNVREIINIREDNMLDTSGFLEQTFLSDITFTEIADDGDLHGIKCNTLLNKILTSLNCRMYQANNMWYIERIWERTAANITYFDYTPTTFQLPGTAISNIGTGTLSSSVAISNTTQPKLLNGGDWAVTQKKTGVSYQFNSTTEDAVELITNPFFENTPTTKSANGMPLFWDVGSDLAPYAGTNMNIQTVNPFTNDVKYKSGLVMDSTAIAAYNAAQKTFEQANHINVSANNYWNRLLYHPDTWAIHAVRRPGDTYSNPWVYVDPTNGSLKINISFYFSYKLTETGSDFQKAYRDARLLITGRTQYGALPYFLIRFVDQPGNCYNLIYEAGNTAFWENTATNSRISSMGFAEAGDFTNLNMIFPDVAFTGQATPLTDTQIANLLLANVNTPVYANFNAVYSVEVPFVAGGAPFPNGPAIYALDVYMYPPIVGDLTYAGDINSPFQQTTLALDKFGICTCDIQYKDSLQGTSGYTKFYKAPDIDNRWSEQVVSPSYGDTMTPGFPGSFRLSYAAPTKTWHIEGQGKAFNFNTSTSDADPGAGKLSLNNATLASATEIFVDAVDDFGHGISSWVTAMASGKNIVLSDYTTNTTQYTFQVTGSIVTASGYYKIPVSYVSGAGTFNSGDAIVAAYQGGQILADVLFSNYASLIATYRRAITGKILNTGGIPFWNSIRDEDGTLYAQTGNQFDFKKAMLTINLEEVSATPAIIDNYFNSTGVVNVAAPQQTTKSVVSQVPALSSKTQSLSLPVVIASPSLKYPTASLLLAYTFNDNNISSFADFSGNKQTGSGTLTSIVAGQTYGYAANFGATNNYITVTPSNFSGLSALTVFTSVYFTALPPTANYCYIINQSGAFNVQVNFAGNIIFNVNTSGGLVTLTSATTISASTWYTIGCVWDGTTLYTYINGIQDANTIACTLATTNNNAVYIGNDTSVDTLHTFNGKFDCIEVRSVAALEADMLSLNTYPGGLFIANTSHNFATGDLVADSSNTFQGIVTWVVDSANFYMYPLSELNNTYSKAGNIYQSSRQYFTQLINDFNGNGDGQIKVMFPVAGWADYISPANTYTLDKSGFAGIASLLAGSTAVTPVAGDNSTKLATTAYVDGKTVSTTGGGTGIDSHSSTGIAQVNSGAWSISASLANGTTATTQTSGDNSTKVATTAYVDAAETLDLKVANNLSDLNNKTTARANLGVGLMYYIGQGDQLTAISANSTYYAQGVTGWPLVTSGASLGVKMTQNGTITSIAITYGVFSRFSSNQNCSLYLNNVTAATSTLLSNTINFSGASISVLYSGLSIAVSAGDIINLKLTTGAFTTTPEGVNLSSQILLQ